MSRATIYFHVACTEFLTFLHADETRGLDAVERAGVLPGYRGIAIHDRLGMYFNYKDATHGVCGAHLLRNLASVAVVWDQQDWASSMTELLVKMKQAAEDARKVGRRHLGAKKLDSFLRRYDRVVAQGLAANPERPRIQAGLRREGVIQPGLCAS